MIWPAKPVFDRYMTRNQIDQRRWNKKRADAARAALVHQLVCGHNGFKAANAGPDHHTGPVLRLDIIRHPS